MTKIIERQKITTYTQAVDFLNGALNGKAWSFDTLNDIRDLLVPLARKEGLEQFRKDLAEESLPDFTDKLLDAIHSECDCWGVWDDEGPFHVKANGRTIEEAAIALREAGGFEDMVIYAISDEVKQEEVWDCEWTSNKPCNEPNCRHNHTEMVYEFYTAYPETELEECCFALQPKAGDTK